MSGGITIVGRRVTIWRWQRRMCCSRRGGRASRFSFSPLFLRSGYGEPSKLTLTLNFSFPSNSARMAAKEDAAEQERLRLAAEAKKKRLGGGK